MNRIIIILNVLLFASCTLHYAEEFNHFYVFLVRLFVPILFLSAINRILYQGSHDNINGYANESRQGIISDIAVSITDFLGDLILIYRCWVIWQHNYYVVILPLLAATAGLRKYKY